MNLWSQERILPALGMQQSDSDKYPVLRIENSALCIFPKLCIQTLA
jgi:hypothetical protein